MDYPQTLQVPELIDTAETAQVLHVKEGTLRYWRHVGEGPPSFTLGRKKVMYRRADVLAWLDSQMAKEGVR